MIIDKLVNFRDYKISDRNILKAFNMLLNGDFNNKEPGKYTIKNDEIYLHVNMYKTKNSFKSHPEQHTKYIDIQYVAAGNEKLGYAPYSKQKKLNKYDTKSDVVFYDCEMSYINFTSGMFAIINTNEIHQPGILLKKSEHVKKIVIKVKDSKKRLPTKQRV